MSLFGVPLVSLATGTRGHHTTRQAAERGRLTSKGRWCAFNEKPRVSMWASPNRDKYMHFSAALKNNCECNSNVTSNYLLLALRGGKCFINKRAVRALFVPNYMSLGGQERPS